MTYKEISELVYLRDKASVLFNDYETARYVELRDKFSNKYKAKLSHVFYTWFDYKLEELLNDKN